MWGETLQSKHRRPAKQRSVGVPCASQKEARRRKERPQTQQRRPDAEHMTNECCAKNARHGSGACFVKCFGLGVLVRRGAPSIAFVAAKVASRHLSVNSGRARPHLWKKNAKKCPTIEEEPDQAQNGHPHSPCKGCCSTSRADLGVLVERLDLHGSRHTATRRNSPSLAGPDFPVRLFVQKSWDCAEVVPVC